MSVLSSPFHQIIVYPVSHFLAPVKGNDPKCSNGNVFQVSFSAAQHKLQYLLKLYSVHQFFLYANIVTGQSKNGIRTGNSWKNPFSISSRDYFGTWTSDCKLHTLRNIHRGHTLSRIYGCYCGWFEIITLTPVHMLFSTCQVMIWWMLLNLQRYCLHFRSAQSNSILSIIAKNTRLCWSLMKWYNNSVFKRRIYHTCNYIFGIP